MACDQVAHVDTAALHQLFREAPSVMEHFHVVEDEEGLLIVPTREKNWGPLYLSRIVKGGDGS